MKIFRAGQIGNDVLTEIKEHLLNDGLLIYPTNTLYGIGCIFFSLRAQKKIDAFKGRSDLPYSAVVHDRAAVDILTSQPLRVLDRLLGELSSARITFLLRRGKGIDPRLVRGSGLIGVRIPEDEMLKNLIRAAGFPLVTTSVNVSGDPPLNDPGQIINMIRGSEYENDVIMIDAGKLPPSAGSTILDLSEEKISIIRQGDDHTRIRKTLQSKFPDLFLDID